MTDPLLDVSHVGVEYRRRGASRPAQSRTFSAVDDVSFQLDKGESLGIVGESGSGKTSLVSAIIGTVPTASGSVFVGGLPATPQSRRRIQMVYQDPVSSLNPRMTIGRMLSEVLVSRRRLGRAALSIEVDRNLDLVGLTSSVRSRRPHEISGGQRQRACLARAVAASPDVLILDEAVAALDVSIQAAVLSTLRNLQASLGFATIFISHDLAVIRNTCERVLVMTDGHIVESGSTDQTFDHPAHGYTKELLASSPEVRFSTSHDRSTTTPN